MQPPVISNRTRWFEISAVLVTGLGKFIFMDWLDEKLVYIVAACLFWLGYVIISYRRDNAMLEYWGLSLTNFGSSFRFLLPFAVVSLAAFVVLGYWRNTLILNWHIIPILIIYPIWGTIQQFIIIALLAGNLKDMQGMQLPKLAIMFITALVFGIVHYPHGLLIVGTFFLALVYTRVYMQQKNIFALGIFHGWMGAFFYYLVLGRDSFTEVFKQIG